MEKVKADDLKLKFLYEFVTEEFVDKNITCIHAGKRAIIQHSSSRKLFVLDVESGKVHSTDVSSHAQLQKAHEYDTIQQGATFAYKNGFGVVYNDMVVLFEDVASNQYKILPIDLPFVRLMEPGIAKPNVHRMAFFEEQSGLLYVIINEIQMGGQHTFYGVIKLDEEKARYIARPVIFTFPDSHPEAESHISSNVENHPVLVGFTHYKNTWCLVVSGRFQNMNFSKTPRKVYFISLNDQFKAGEVLGEMDCHDFNYAQITGDEHYLSSYTPGNKLKEIVFESFEGDKRYRINLKSKKIDFRNLGTNFIAAYALSGYYYWHADGSDKINVYQVDSE